MPDSGNLDTATWTARRSAPTATRSGRNSAAVCRRITSAARRISRTSRIGQHRSPKRPAATRPASPFRASPTTIPPARTWVAALGLPAPSTGGTSIPPPSFHGGSSPVAPKFGPANPRTRSQSRSPESSCPSLRPEACLPERSPAPAAKGKWLVAVSVYENATYVVFASWRGGLGRPKMRHSAILAMRQLHAETLGPSSMGAAP